MADPAAAGSPEREQQSAGAGVRWLEEGLKQLDTAVLLVRTLACSCGALEHETLEGLSPLTELTEPRSFSHSTRGIAGRAAVQMRDRRSHRPAAKRSRRQRRGGARRRDRPGRDG